MLPKVLVVAELLTTILALIPLDSLVRKDVPLQVSFEREGESAILVRARKRPLARVSAEVVKELAKVGSYVAAGFSIFSLLVLTDEDPLVQAHLVCLRNYVEE